MPRAIAVLSLALAATAGLAAGDQIGFLREGNRLYREGRLEEAFEVYQQGYVAEAVHPILAYNTATTAHHLGKVPQAILWYRRADTVNPGDPWLRENLALARADLGLQPYPAPGVAGLVARHSRSLFYLAALLAWGGLLLWIRQPRGAKRATVALVASGVLLYGITYLAVRTAPRAAVILEQCSGAAGDLPPGTEAWITAETEAGYEIAAGGARVECPRAAVAPVTEAG